MRATRSRKPPQRQNLPIGALILVSLMLFVAACQGSTSTGSDGTSSSGDFGNTSPAVTKKHVPDITPLTTDPSYAKGGQPAGGIPGITPAGSGPLSPDAITQFVNTHPFPDTPADHKPHVTLVKIMPGSDISALLGGEPTYAPDGAPLAFVQVTGDFSFPGSSADGQVPFQTAFEVFDATNGNLLMYGGLHQPVTTPPPATPTPAGQPTQVPPTTVPPTSVPPTATHAPVVHFAVTPSKQTQSCSQTLTNPFLTLDNTGSQVDVGWKVTITEKAPDGNPWATPSLTSGTVPANNSQALTLTLEPSLCRIQTQTVYHATITLTSGGTGNFVFTETINPQVIG
ncbi:MAG: hypothetical protein H0X24_10915 [Ktedonobacterales bacterium]|nr:hypothetical protein [Ktedonobacterales bacterium]